MIDVIILEIISLLSFLYSLIFMFASFAPIKEMVIVFIFTAIVSIIYALNYRKSKLFEVFFLLLYIPLIFYRSKIAIFFFFVTTVFTYIYIKKSLLKGNHNEYVIKMKISYLLFGFLMLVSTNFYDSSGSVKYALVFIVIYLVSSIILTRISRHLDSNMDIKKIRKTNIKYLMILAIAFSILVFDDFRGYIVNILQNILQIIFYPLYWIFRVPGSMNDANIESQLNIENTEKVLEELPIEEISEEMELFRDKAINLLELFINISAFIIILVLIYIIYKLLIKVGSRGEDTLDYTEEREFIKNANKEKKKKKFSIEKYPKELREQVRYYYRKYLGKVNDNGNKILKSDTSLDINKKAIGFDKETIEIIRNIYINIRYGNKEAKEETVKEIEELYKRL